MSKTFQSVHPFDQKLFAEYPVMDAAQVDVVLKNSTGAFLHWRSVDPDMRSDLLLKVADVLRSNKEKYAHLITMEMGKILSESLAEVEKCAWNCTYFAEHTGYMLENETIQTDADQSYIAFEPIGCVFAIMPWNFPFWQVFRFAAPVLMAGNTIILKHAPNVCGCAQALQQIFMDAGFPEHVFQTVIIDTDQVEQIIAHDIVQGVTLTGSERAGRAVAALTGKYAKKTILELGGSDALIVLQDADLTLAAGIALQSRFQNAGQSCIAAKRFIVDTAVKNDFLDALLAGIKKLKQGDPLAVGTTTGPMARVDLAAQLHEQVKVSVRNGAELLTGGMCEGANFQPSLLDLVAPGMPAFDEELFGPVACLITAADAEHAVQLANESRFGLGATLFSRNITRATALANMIRSGSVYINALMRSDPRLPFGGIKSSGYGRELSHYGLKEFTNIKTVYIQE